MKKIKIGKLLYIILLIISVYIWLNYLKLIDKNYFLNEKLKRINNENYIINKKNINLLEFYENNWNKKNIINKEMIIENNYEPSSWVCYNSITKITNNNWSEEIIFGNKNKQYCVSDISYIDSETIRIFICYSSWAWSWECEQSIFDYNIFKKEWKYVKSQYLNIYNNNLNTNLIQSYGDNENFKNFIDFFIKNYFLKNYDLIFNK